MNKIKYIDLDAHKSSISIAVLGATGKRIMEVAIETQAAALLDFIRGLRGTLYVASEEGACAAWLYALLAPQVARVVVCDPRQNPRLLGEKKSDRLDARKLAEWLRTGTYIRAGPRHRDYIARQHPGRLARQAGSSTQHQPQSWLWRRKQPCRPR